MQASDFQLFKDQKRSNWIRLRTLVALRWFAICGQVATVFVAVRFYDLQLAVGLLTLAILTAVAVNVILTFIYPENKRLSEYQATFWLVFDLLQLSLLLFLSGGLNNPFALLIMAPVTVAATALSLSGIALLARIHRAGVR